MSLTRRKYGWIRLFILILAFSVTWNVPAWAFAADNSECQQKTVRVGYYEDNNGFQLGFSDGERKSGYAYEYYQEVSKYAGWKYEYVYGSWSELYDQLLSGDVDIMAGVSKTDERMEQMLFPENVMGTESYYIFVPVNYHEIKSNNIDTLNGKRIGVNDKSLMLTLFQQYVKENALDCQILTYDGHFSCAEALEKGEIDGYIITDNYVVEDVKPIIKIGASDIYFAISKKRQDLLVDINKAQEQILAAAPYYITYLQSKYFDRSILRQALNDDELSWLKDQQSIHIGYLDGQMPYCGTNEQTGDATGLIATLQTNISSFLSVPVQLSAYQSADELLRALKASEIDAAFPIYGDTWTAEQSEVYLTDEIASDRMVAIYDGDYDVALLRQSAVVKEGFGQLPYLRQYYPDTEIVFYNRIADCVAAIKSGETGCMIADNNIMQRYFSEHSQDAELHFAYLDHPVSFAMAVSQNSTILQSILNKTITHIDGSKLTDAVTRNTYAAASYSFSDFIKHNIWIVIASLTCLLLLLALLFVVYRKNSIQHQKQLTAANQAKSEFLSRMSHDIRTPMNAIVNLTNMAKEETEDKIKLANDLERISISSEFLLGLINDILDMSRIENGKLELSPSLYHYNELMSYLDGVIKPLCAQKKILFLCNMGDIGDLKDLWVDRTRFNQIFFNILSNAVKYTHEGGQVSLSIANKRGEKDCVYCDFIVQDNGCGMDESFLSKIFLPFERANNTDAYEGTGLGLAITKSIVEAMSGSISVSSQVGVGTTVTIHLRLPYATKEQSARHDSSAKKSQNLTMQNEMYAVFKGKRILIAEDHPLNQEIINRLLSKVGFNPDCVENGKACVERFRSSGDREYCAILMDIRMPVMDGLTASREIRSINRPWAKAIPIIAMTANAFTDDELASKKAGMNAHLSKPVEPDKLYQVLAAHIQA